MIKRIIRDNAAALLLLVVVGATVAATLDALGVPWFVIHPLCFALGWFWPFPLKVRT